MAARARRSDGISRDPDDSGLRPWIPRPFGGPVRAGQRRTGSEPGRKPFAKAHPSATPMSLEVYIDWQGETRLVGHLYAAERGSAVSFQYALEWLQRDDAFAIDPTSLPLQRGVHHGRTLFGAIQDCGPDRWGRMLVERAVRKKVLAQKPYRDVDYVLALDDAPRVGALR